jgi:hypothetical protein
MGNQEREGTGVLKVDGKTVDTRTPPRTVPFIHSEDETFEAKGPMK